MCIKPFAKRLKSYTSAMKSRGLLLLAAIAVAVTGTSVSNPGTPSTALKDKVAGNPAPPTATSMPPGTESKTPAKRRPSMKPANNTKKPGPPPTGSPAASGRTRPPRPRPRQFQPTIGDLLGLYGVPLLGPDFGIGSNNFAHFGQGFNNPGPIPHQFSGFNSPNMSPYTGGQWPYNHLPNNHLQHQPPGAGQAFPYPAPPAASKLFFIDDKMTALLNLPSQLTALMNRVGVKAFSLKLKEWLQSLPIQTQPPIDGRLEDDVGCVRGSPLGQRRDQKAGGTKLKGDVMTTESGTNEVHLD